MREGGLLFSLCPSLSLPHSGASVQRATNIHGIVWLGEEVVGFVRLCGPLTLFGKWCHMSFLNTGSFTKGRWAFPAVCYENQTLCYEQLRGEGAACPVVP